MAHLAFEGEDGFYFDGSSKGQGCHLNGTTRRERGCEVLCVDGVDSLEVRKVRHENRGLDGLVERDARSFCNGPKIGEDLMRCRFDIVLDESAGGGVDGQLP